MKVLHTAFATLLIFACAAVPAGAEKDEEATTHGELLLFEDIPSVYTASKHDQIITEAPANVSIVTEDEIKKYGYRNLAEILRSLPGLYLTYDRNYHYLGARGFSRPGDYNSRLLLLVDGVRLNDSVYDAASVGTEFPLDIDLIERVEVVRGPGSSLYGSNALFGVINVITRSGRDIQGMELSGDIGSQESYKGRLTFGKRLASGLEMIFSGTYFESKGDDSLYFAEFDDPATNNGVFENNDDTQVESFFGKVSYRDFTLEGAFGDREKGLPTASYGTVFNNSQTFTDDRQYFASLTYEHRYTQGWDVLARIDYIRYPFKGDYAYDWAEESDEPDIIVNRDEADGEWWGIDTHGTRLFFDTHRLTIGAEYRDNLRQDQKNYDEEIYLDDRRSSRFWAAFIQDEWEITDGLIVSAGIRHDYFEDYNGNTSPRAALIYAPFERSVLKFLYAEAFRIPNAYEQYYHDGDETQKRAPLLEPETASTYELIWEQFLGDRLRGAISFFFYEIDNLIDLETDPEDGLLVFANVDEVEARGLELELEGNWSGGIAGRASYTYQDAENRQTGKNLTNSPRHLAKFNLIVPVVAERLFAGAELQYMSGRKTESGSETADTLLTNLTLFDQTLPQRLQISASVYNLFDEDIEHPTFDELVQDVILQDGRTFRLKLTFAF